MAAHTLTVGQICVAPLSSPYSLLPRTHTYALAASLFIPLPRGWLFRAALATFTTRTAIFAVDAAVILHTVSGMRSSIAEPVPLDAVVVLEILGLAVIVACWLLLASGRASESCARLLIRVWAAAVTIASILAFVSVAKLGKAVAKDTADTGISNGLCEGVWMDEQDVFGTVEHVSVLGPMGWKFGWLAHRVGIPPLVFSVIALLAILVPKKRGVAARRAEVDQEPSEILMEMPGRQLHSAEKALNHLLWLALPAMGIFIAVSTEQYLLAMTSNTPSVEKMSSVGQWGVWAATWAVLFAALAHAVREKMGLKKENTKPAEDESSETVIM